MRPEVETLAWHDSVAALDFVRQEGPLGFSLGKIRCNPPRFLVVKPSGLSRRAGGRKLFDGFDQRRTRAGVDGQTARQIGPMRVHRATRAGQPLRIGRVTELWESPFE